MLRRGFFFSNLNSFYVEVKPNGIKPEIPPLLSSPLKTAPLLSPHSLLIATILNDGLLFWLGENDDKNDQRLFH